MHRRSLLGEYYEYLYHWANGICMRPFLLLLRIVMYTVKRPMTVVSISDEKLVAGNSRATNIWLKMSSPYHATSSSSSFLGNAVALS